MIHVDPQRDAETVNMRGNEKVADRREGYRSGSTRENGPIDLGCRRKVPDAESTVHTRADDPAARRRESKVGDWTRVAGEPTDDAVRLQVDDPDAQIVGSDRCQQSSWGGEMLHHGDGTGDDDVMLQGEFVEIPQPNMTVQ